jgi:hypothetical protein
LTASTFHTVAAVEDAASRRVAQPRLGLPHASLNHGHHAAATISFLGYEIDSQPRKKAKWASSPAPRARVFRQECEIKRSGSGPLASILP